jgi:hypothetical protein
MLRHVYFPVGRSLRGGCEGIEQPRQRLRFRNLVTRSVAVPTAIPRVAKFATASAGIHQL